MKIMVFIALEIKTIKIRDWCCSLSCPWSM